MASLSLRPNHHHHHPATIKSKPRSIYLLCAFFVSHSHGWSESKPRWSQNPNPFNPKLKVDWSEGCKGWSDPFLCCGCEGWSKPPPALQKTLISLLSKNNVVESLDLSQLVQLKTKTHRIVGSERLRKLRWEKEIAMMKWERESYDESQR